MYYFPLAAQCDYGGLHICVCEKMQTLRLFCKKFRKNRFFAQKNGYNFFHRIFSGTFCSQHLFCYRLATKKYSYPGPLNIIVIELCDVMFANYASRTFSAHIQKIISPRHLVVDQRCYAYCPHQLTYFLHACTC